MRRLAIWAFGIQLIGGACDRDENKAANEAVDKLVTADKSATPPETPGGAHSAHDKPPTPARVAHSPGKLTVTLDGKPVAIKAAIAWKDWDGAVRVTVSSVVLHCDDVRSPTDGPRSPTDGEVTFDVTAAPVLQPDGTLAPELRSTYFDSSTVVKRFGKTTMSGDGTPGQAITLDVDLEMRGAGDNAATLRARGTIEAVGCAARDAKRGAPLPAEMPASITIAGKTLPIRVAQFQKNDKWPSLTLYTGAHPCSSCWSCIAPSEFEIELTWFDAAKPEVSQVRLGGSLLAPGADPTFDKAKLTVTPIPTGAGVVTITSDIVVADYPIKIAGQVTVTGCSR